MSVAKSSWHVHQKRKQVPARAMQQNFNEDLKAALAYRHKCIRQKQELQLFHKQFKFPGSQALH